MMGTVSLYRGSVIEWTENIARKHQRVCRSKNNHQFASYTFVGDFSANNNKNRKTVKVYII